jgi:hypothetical protein
LLQQQRLQQQQQQHDGLLGISQPAVTAAGDTGGDPFTASAGWPFAASAAAAAAGDGVGGAVRGRVRFDSVTSPNNTPSAAAEGVRSPQQQQQQQQQMFDGPLLPGGSPPAAAAGQSDGLLTGHGHSISTGSMQLLDSGSSAAAAAAAAGVGSGPVSDGVLLAALRRQLQAEGGPSGELPLSLAPTMSLTTQ